MFKFDNTHPEEPKKQVYSTKRSQEKNRKNPSFGIRLINHSLEENKPNLNNRRKIDIVSSGNKSQENTQRNSAAKGIQVTSSRQGSTQRRQLTSRSRQKPSESRQIRSQSHVSQFEAESEVQQREPSFQDRPPSVNEYEELCLKFQHKMKELIVRSQVSARIEAQQLRDTINDNEQRITNLIGSLNTMIQKNQKKEKLIQKLEERLTSLTSYHEQCYSFNLQRCRDIQNMFKIVVEEMEAIDSPSLLRKIGYVDQLIRDVFMSQIAGRKEDRQNQEKEIRKLYKMSQNVQNQVDQLELMYISRQKLKGKQKCLQNYLEEVKNQIKSSQKQPISLPQNPIQPQKLQDINRTIQSLSSKIQILEQNSFKYKRNEEKAQQTIWQLSNLLNKHERDIQKMTEELQKRENELQTTQLYNKQIQNKLIQSKLKQNSLRGQMQSFCKTLQVSKHYQLDQIQKEKDCFKEKFQELFRHNQYLEEINCKNKIQIMTYQKQIQQLKDMNSRNQKELEEFARVKGEMNIKEEYWKNKAKLQALALDSTLRGLRQDNSKHQSTIVQNSKQILKLQMQLQKQNDEKIQLQTNFNTLKAQFLSLKDQFQQQQEYSDHLQQQNETLSTNLNQYKAIFQNQSFMFKNTINKLKQENTQLHKNLELQSDKIFANQPKKYTPQSHRSPSTFSSDSPKTRKSLELPQRQSVV